jgi:hypothetical protein
MNPSKTMEQILDEKILDLKENFNWMKYSRIKDIIDINYNSHDP